MTELSEISSEISSEMSYKLCPNCHVGHLLEEHSTYTHWHEGQLVVVPSVPAQVCDYCGEIYFHPVVLERLHQLLWADTNQQTKRDPSRTPRPIRSLHRKTTTLRSDP
jgi:YgiT-type zinc finger domain-containing protein